MNPRLRNTGAVGRKPGSVPTAPRISQSRSYLGRRRYGNRLRTNGGPNKREIGKYGPSVRNRSVPDLSPMSERPGALRLLEGPAILTYSNRGKAMHPPLPPGKFAPPGNSPPPPEIHHPQGNSPPCAVAHSSAIASAGLPKPGRFSPWWKSAWLGGTSSKVTRPPGLWTSVVSVTVFVQEQRLGEQFRVVVTAVGGATNLPGMSGRSVGPPTASTAIQNNAPRVAQGLLFYSP